jgi:hypothetical protein
MIDHRVERKISSVRRNIALLFTKVGSGDEALSNPRVAFAQMLVGFRRDPLSYERRTWNAIVFSGPRPQIRDLTTLGTEGTPGICFPSRGLLTQGTSHGCSVTSETNEVQLPERRLISALGFMLSFLNLGPGIFERHSSVEEESLG